MAHRFQFRRSRRQPETPATSRRRAASSGQSLIEFAIIGLVLLTMSLAVIDFGRAFSASMAVTHASRDGARLAMNPDATDAEIIAAARAAAAPYDTVNISVERSPVVGEMAKVTVTYQFDAIAPLVENLWGGGSLTISESTTSRVGWE